MKIINLRIYSPYSRIYMSTPRHPDGLTQKVNKFDLNLPKWTADFSLKQAKNLLYTLSKKKLKEVASSKHSSTLLLHLFYWRKQKRKSIKWLTWLIPFNIFDNVIIHLFWTLHIHNITSCYIRTPEIKDIAAARTFN